MKAPLILASLAALLLSLTGCSNPTPVVVVEIPTSTASAATQPPTAVPATLAVPTTTSIPLPEGVTIYYEENAQVELIGPDGQRVLIDVYDPNKLSSPAVDGDILLTTHTHPDHVQATFYKAFTGEQLFTQVGSIERPGLQITGIASSHSATTQLVDVNASNYIYIIEMGGLRIAHFGDIGQETLTGDQLAALGQVDIAITQLSNRYSQMDTTNKKGFNLMDQVKPRLIVLTDRDLDAVEYSATVWPCTYTDKPSITISASQLPEETTLIFMGDLAAAYQKMLNLTPAEW